MNTKNIKSYKKETVAWEDESDEQKDAQSEAESFVAYDFMYLPFLNENQVVELYKLYFNQDLSQFKLGEKVQSAHKLTTPHVALMECKYRLDLTPPLAFDSKRLRRKKG